MAKSHHHGLLAKENNPVMTTKKTKVTVVGHIMDTVKAHVQTIEIGIKISPSHVNL